MPTRPQSPTLFPYTTLFRSHARRARGGDAGRGRGASAGGGAGARRTRGAGVNERRLRWTIRLGIVLRSEEHTSELQSRLHLVCRLLLEKKKKPETFISPFSK